MNKILEEHVLRLELHIKEVVFRRIAPKRLSFSLAVGTFASIKMAKHCARAGRATPWKMTDACLSRSKLAS
jgi:hypothetical protein